MRVGAENLMLVQRLFAWFLVIALSACLTQRAAGENCITQAQMDAPTRDTLVQEGLAAGKALLLGDAAAIAEASAPDFATAAQSNAGPLTRATHGASLTVDALWILEATDVAANQQNAQFFCGIANAPAHSTFNFSSYFATLSRQTSSSRSS